MTIFVDPYHTTAGVTLDMSKTITPLKESTIRNSMNGTNLEVRTMNNVHPVFITGCRDSERAIEPFAHPIFIKNFNGKSYLFTDMTAYITSGGTLDTISSHIRRREEFNFHKSRGIASLAWVAGETERFRSRMGFAGDVFAEWMSQAISRAGSLDFIATKKIQMLALAYWETLFMEGTIDVSKNDDVIMKCAQRAAANWRIPVSDAARFYRTVDIPMSSISDFCANVVKSVDSVNLNPIPGRPGTGFNLRTLLGLIADSWFADNSKPILATSLEHPPTLCAIIYYCLNYNNFKRQQLGQVIEAAGKGGKARTFDMAFQLLLEEYLTPERQPVSVMEFLNPETFQEDDDSAVKRLLEELHGESADNGFTKELNTNEDFGFEAIDSSMRESAEENKSPGVVDAEHAALPKTVMTPDSLNNGRPLL